MTDGNLGECYDWYHLIDDLRRVAAYLHCDFFALVDRLERGEVHWYHWGAAALAAQEEAYGPGGLPVSTTWSAPWGWKRKE